MQQGDLSVQLRISFRLSVNRGCNAAVRTPSYFILVGSHVFPRTKLTCTFHIDQSLLLAGEPWLKI